MIELHDVSKWYVTNNGVRHILRNFSLALPSDLNVGIMGPNGSGKSTFLRMVGGAEFPNSGRVVSDERISWPLGLGGGFQGSLSGRENVEFVCRINGLSRQAMHEVVDFVYTFSGIGEYFTMPVKTYSSGMRGRVTFGLSLALKFDAYLVDELTSVGDIAFRRKAAAAFESMRSRARIFFASHTTESVREFCDVGLVFRGDGQVEYFESVDDAIAAYEELMGERRAKRRAGRTK